MAETSSPPSMDIDVVVDLHTSTNATAAAAAAAAQALLESSSNASSDAGFNIKLPVLYTSSSDTETDDYHIQRNRMPTGGGSESTGAVAIASTSIEVVRSSSPPPNCAICLGRCKNKCFTDSCVHQFCFKCLCEWSKVKAECPLCKQTFRSIIHNVKANDEYEEYLVQQPVVQIPHSPLEVTYNGPINGGFILNGRRYYNFSMRSWASQAGPHNIMGSRAAPISIRNYMHDDELTIPSAGVAVNPAVEGIPMRRSELLNMYRQELPDEISSTLSLSQLWRRYIYDRKLYAFPVSDITGRYRESSARFYRNNPGQRIRLIPFANRDIVCLLRNTNHDVSTVLESLNEGLEVSNILSRSFRRRLQPYLGERTAHFIHELSNFARSPFDMIGYDRAVQYAPQAPDEDHVIEFSTSSDEEANNISGQSEHTNTTNTINLSSESSNLRQAVRRHAQATSTTSRTRNAGTSEFRVQSRSSAQAGMLSPMNLLSFTITTTSEGSETPGLSVAVSAGSRGHAQVAAINLSTHNRAHNEVVIDLDDTVELNGSSNVDAASPATTNVNTNNNANAIGNNDITSPMPAANQMPEGSPQVVVSIALSTSSSDECEFVLERKPPHLRTPEMVSLNSESDSDVVFVDETKSIMAEATYSTSENEEQPSLARLMIEQEDLQQPSASAGLRPRAVRQLVATKRQSTSSQRPESSPSKKRRLRTRRMNTPPEYSSSGSTSDDYCNDADSEYNAKRQPRSRGTGRKNGTRTRKGNSSRRPLKKRRRTMNSKNEMPITQDTEQDINAPFTNEPNTKKRRISTKRHSNESKTAQNLGSSTKHTSSSDEESSSEDDKMNLKALQLRLKKSLSDVEDNMKHNAYDFSIYSPPTHYDEMSSESNRHTANNNNNNNNNKNNNNNYNINGDNNDVDNHSLLDGPSCSTAALRKQADTIIAQKLVAGTTPPTSPQRPTTSGAAAAAAIAAAAAAAAVASISSFNEQARRVSFEESNTSFEASCIHSNAETPQTQREQQEEDEDTPAHFNLGSMSPASLSLSPPSTESPSMAHVYDNDSLGSIYSVESYQLPSTSRKNLHGYASSKVTEPTFNAHLNYSDSSNSSTTSSSSSSSAWSGSEDQRDSHEHPLA